MSESAYNPKPEIPFKERAPLREGVQSLSVEIVDIDEGNEELETLREQMEMDTEETGTVHWIDFDGGDLEEMAAAGIKHDGVASYFISPISERNWFSDRYFNCTAVVAIGRDTATGKEVSFLSHQDPAYFIDGEDEKKIKFRQEMANSLNEIRARCEEGTVEVLLFGGNFTPPTSASPTITGYVHEHYERSIKELRSIVRESLGFDPKVAAGPNNTLGSETITAVDTKNRKLFIERDKQSAEFDQSFQANELEEKVKEWEALLS